MSDTPTPRTDTVCDRFSSGLMGSGEVMAFMEQLERELAAATERIRRLEEAGDYMVNALWATDKQAVRAWKEAKGAKP
jgi:hypothetical protein